jgi:signal transduction histidine kinase
MAEAAGLPIDLLFNLHPVVEAYRQADQLEPEAPAFEVVLDKMTYLVTLTQARDETGAVFGRVLMLKDITYLKQLDQFKSQMVQLASHDLRTPLGVAIGYLEVLKEELRPVSSFQQQTLTGLETALNRMQTLVTDLLDLERVEAGIDHSRVMIDVNTLAAEAVTEFEVTADARRQRLECSLSAGALLVAGDPTRLKQAIGNLISNAVKYTPEGGSIWVRVRPDDRHVLIEVQDTGYGIPAEVQAKLFQRFFRARVPGTEHVPGTGLGLSLTKAVIEQHAGHVTAESKEGQGSTFRIWLPLAANEDTTS